MQKTIKLTAIKENFDVLLKWLNEILDLWNLNKDLINKINVCLEEIYVNIVSYAYDNQKGTAEISIAKAENEIVLTFKDEGVEYNPLQKEDPDTSLSLEERPIGGLGIYMIKNIADQIYYKRENDKNILTLIFKIS